MKKCIRKIMLVSVITVSVPLTLSSAWADINYTFIKMSCDVSAKAATINAFYDWNEEGAARVGRNEKDTYYLDEVAKSHREITCDLPPEYSVSFVAYQDEEHPRNDWLEIFLNHKSIQRFTLADQWNMRIDMVDADKFDFTFCPSHAHSLHLTSPDELAHPHNLKKKCEILHIANGLVTGSEIFDAPQKFIKNTIVQAQ